MRNWLGQPILARSRIRAPKKNATSIWTFNRFLIGFTALALAGCSGGNGGLFTSKAPAKIVVASKSVTIAGPRGYCVDTSETDDSESGAFVLLGSCASVAGNHRLAAPETLGLLTASVSPETSMKIDPASSPLTDYFKSQAGQSALARNGEHGSVEILSTEWVGNAFLVQLSDTSEADLDGISETYWRGLFDVNNRIVTVSVVGFDSAPMSAAQGRTTLNSFVRRIESENTAISQRITIEKPRGGFLSRLLRSKE